MTLKNTLVAAMLAFGTLTLPVTAQSPEPVVLDPITHQVASLTLVSPSGERRFTPAELEALGAHRLSTVTPWRPEGATFDGVLLTTLLDIAGLSDAQAIKVSAENDYAITMPREVWANVPILVATRVNGEAHSRRARGPIQFVMPMELYETMPDMKEGYWVWMAARIAAAD